MLYKIIVFLKQSNSNLMCIRATTIPYLLRIEGSDITKFQELAINHKWRVH